MATLPSARDLGLAPVNPSLGTVSYRGDSGMEGASSRLMVQSAGDVDKIGQFLFKAQEEQAKTDAQDGLNKYREKLNELAYSETGWTNVKGGNTNQEYFKKTQTSFDEARQAVEGSITDPLARKIFSQHAAVETIQSQSALMRHMSQQQQAYRNSTYTNGIKLDMGDAYRDWGHDDLFNLRINRMARNTADNAKDNGASEEESKVAVQSIVDEAWLNRITAAKNAGDISRATELYKQARDGIEINGEAVSLSTKGREAIDTMLNPALSGNKEMKVINSVWDRMGPVKDEIVQIEPMMDWIRKEYPNESASFFENVRAGLTGRANVRETDTNKSVGKNYGILQNALESGASLQQLQKMDEWTMVKPEHQAALRRAWKVDVLQNASIANQVAGRRDAEASRELTQIRTQIARVEIDGTAPTMRLLANPVELNKFSEDELIALTPKIGPGNVKSLLEKKERLQNPANVPIHAETFNMIVGKHIPDVSSPPGKRSDEDNARIMQVTTAVDIALQDWAKKEGRPPSIAEQKTIINEVLDVPVLVKGTFGATKQVPAATTLWSDEKPTYPIRGRSKFAIDAKPGDKEMSPIPASVLEKYAKMLRAYFNIGPETKDEAIIQANKEGVEKAYGAVKAGARNDEAIRLLYGKQ